MLVTMMKSKLHRATVTQADLHYVGSVTIDAELMDAADSRIRIPMVGRANSLNVATSAAIVLYEAVRQRGTR